MARRLIPLLAACALGGASLPAQAADMSMRDPTRPADANGFAGDDMPSESLSIIHPSNAKAGGKTVAKPQAIIDGTLVSVGSKLGAATVLAIGTDRVVLKNADGTRDTRFLTPGIDKKPAARPSLHSSNVSRQP